MEGDKVDLVRRRGIYLLPNLLTVSALLAGFYAIVLALVGKYDEAAIAVFVAMLFDGLDGKVARLTSTSTAFGAELDSLSDMVSFGLAPSLIMYMWALSGLGKIGWIAAFIYVVATALRLARFNTQIGTADKRYFQGLPSTASGGVIVGIVWLGFDLGLDPHKFALLSAIFTILVGVLMVSNIRYNSFKEVNFRDHVPFVVILVTVLILILVSIDPAKVLFAIFFLYACSGPISTILEVRRKKKLRKASLKEGKL
jgi:CDP-diacylglycerol---serine O-phosphatidyltransferase